MVRILFVVAVLVVPALLTGCASGPPVLQLKSNNPPEKVVDCIMEQYNKVEPSAAAMRMTDGSIGIMFMTLKQDMLTLDRQTLANVRNYANGSMTTYLNANNPKNKSIPHSGVFYQAVTKCQSSQ